MRLTKAVRTQSQSQSSVGLWKYLKQQESRLNPPEDDSLRPITLNKEDFSSDQNLMTKNHKVHSGINN